MPTETLRPSSSKWPKQPLELTEEQVRISNDWMEYFHTINHQKFSGFVDFGHRYVADRRGPAGSHTLEIGAGLGAQLDYEPESQKGGFIAVESRLNMAAALHARFPGIGCCLGDCQGLLPFRSGSMDRVIAIHVLEHLCNLPACLEVVHRILKPTGKFLVVIPCEGGLAYAVARHFTSKALFEKRYKTSYEWHIRSEHVNFAWEILEELDRYFKVDERHYYPFRLPLIHLNAAIALNLSPR